MTLHGRTCRVTNGALEHEAGVIGARERDIAVISAERTFLDRAIVPDAEINCGHSIFFVTSSRVRANGCATRSCARIKWNIRGGSHRYFSLPLPPPSSRPINGGICGRHATRLNRPRRNQGLRVGLAPWRRDAEDRVPSEIVPFCPAGASSFGQQSTLPLKIVLRQ